jgi:hypothetical protein
MWGALLAASLTGWLHQLTATPAVDGTLAGHGVRHGQAMMGGLHAAGVRVSVVALFTVGGTSAWGPVR